MRFTLLLLCCSLAAETRLVLLGTGTPNADPDRAGPSLAIVVDDAAYLIDFGPGVVRRASAAARQGTTALRPSNLKLAFVTHLHSDHTAGLADLFLTPAVLERNAPLALYGPPGTAAMAKRIRAAYQADIINRTKGLEPSDARGYQFKVTEFKPGEIYRDARVTVCAFRVEHAGWPHAYGFRFVTPDGVIVVSGDCTPAEAVVEACQGCDLLVHEVYSVAGFAKRPPEWQRYHAKAHTSSLELGRLAGRAKPKRLVLTHQLLWSASQQQLLDEIRSVYDGAVHFGNDLDVFTLPARR